MPSDSFKEYILSHRMPAEWILTLLSKLVIANLGVLMWMRLQLAGCWGFKMAASTLNTSASFKAFLFCATPFLLKSM